MNENGVGNYIRQLRKARGYSIVQLSELSGVSNPYISQIENNKFKPSPEILKKLSDALGEPYIELLFEAGYIEKPITYDDLKNTLTRAIEKRERILLNISLMYDELKQAKKTKDDEKVKNLTKEIPSVEKALEDIGFEISQLQKVSFHFDTHLKKEADKLEKSTINFNKSISLKELLNSYLSVEVNGKILTKDDKEKILKISETMFSNNNN